VKHIIYFAFVDPLKKFKQTIKADIDTIAQQFKKFVPTSDTPVFMEHYQRANAFLICCQPNQQSNKKLLKKYVDAYGSLAEQMNIIQECAATLVNSNKIRCKMSLENLEKARQLTMK